MSKFQELTTQWRADAPRFAARGVVLNSAVAYVPPEWKGNFALAMDEQPTLTTDPNSGIPAYLTTMVDPQIFEILFAPNKAAEILGGEVKKGAWTDQTAMFPVVEHTGEVSSYGDFNTNGRAGVNTNWPQRQSYLFQTVKEWGELEIDRAGLARIQWVTEVDKAAATVMAKFMNLSYFYGIDGLENYGLINDPGLSAPLTPATKAAGGTAWINGSGVIVATANEIYTDIESMFVQLVTQNQGLVDRESKMTMALGPTSEAALTATNSFNVNVSDLLKKNFPNLRVISAVQYEKKSAANPQGVAGGNLVQLVANDIEGQPTGYSAFNEKMRGHPIIRALSSFQQKLTGGTWGTIIRMPVAISQMLGV